LIEGSRVILLDHWLANSDLSGGDGVHLGVRSNLKVLLKDQVCVNYPNHKFFDFVAC